MPSLLYLDCFSGASGDMLLGALLDLGMPIEELRRSLGSLGIGGYRLEADRVVRSGIGATQFKLTESPEPERAHVGHASGHGSHRTLAEIHRLIDQAALSPTGRARGHELFERLASVESEIHHIPVESIHLHEVGALDSIIDIVGIVAGLEWLKPDRIACSPLNVGGGSVETAHGTLPVPAPATARLLEGLSVYSSGAPVELVTPTGALIISSYAQQCGPLPMMRIMRMGYGAGTRDIPGRPNVLRMLVGEVADEITTEDVISVECEIDDMNPQLYGALMDRLYAIGALEVFYTPVQMKKNRPGTLVTVIAAPPLREAVAATLFRETTTIGVRYRTLERECLEREMLAVETPLGVVRFKVARRGGVVMNASPEFEDCLRLAKENERSPKEVQSIAIRAYGDFVEAKARETGRGGS